MALTYTNDTVLAKQIKQMVSRAVTTTSVLGPAQQALLFMSALAAASNINNEALRLATVKWVSSRNNRVDLSPMPRMEG